MKNVIHQLNSKNEWLLLSGNFTTKFGLVFVLTLENAFGGFILKQTAVPEIIKIAFRLRNRQVFLWQSVEILNIL